MLHTWTQRLMPHYYLHCLVAGGAWRAAAKPPGEDGNATEGVWRSAHSRYLFGKDALILRLSTPVHMLDNVSRCA